VVSDQLSQVFDLVEIRGLVSGGFAARDPWVARAPIEDPLKLIAMVYGRTRLTTDGIDRPIELEPGDVAILNNRSWLEQEGGAGDGPRQEILPEENFTWLAGADRGTDDVVIGIAVNLNLAGQALLLQALPPVGHVRASATASTKLRGSLDRLFDEVTGNQIGSEFAIRQHGQLLLLEVLRAYIDQAELPGMATAADRRTVASGTKPHARRTRKALEPARIGTRRGDVTNLLRRTLPDRSGPTTTDLPQPLADAPGTTRSPRPGRPHRVAGLRPGLRV
jgi:hypothetical protein